MSGVTLEQNWVLDRSVVTETGCWEWILKRRSNGYARMTFKQASWYAHRFSYWFFKGEIPEGLFVCHHCDNPACVNPEHLFLGTAADNSQDAVLKGRIAKGKDLPHAKLTQHNLNQAKWLQDMGLIHRHIAPVFGVTRSSISTALRRQKCKA